MLLQLLPPPAEKAIMDLKQAAPTEKTARATRPRADGGGRMGRDTLGASPAWGWVVSNTQSLAFGTFFGRLSPDLGSTMTFSSFFCSRLDLSRFFFLVELPSRSPFGSRLQLDQCLQWSLDWSFWSRLELKKNSSLRWSLFFFVQLPEGCWSLISGAFSSPKSALLSVIVHFCQ